MTGTDLSGSWTVQTLYVALGTQSNIGPFATGTIVLSSDVIHSDVEDDYTYLRLVLAIPA